MDINKLRATARISFRLNGPEPIDLEFEVRPIAFDLARTMVGQADLTEIERRLVADAIVDWNLEENGQKIECNAENKAKYLEFLFRMRTDQDDANPVGTTILDRLFEFASDQKNFFVS